MSEDIKQEEQEQPTTAASVSVDEFQKAINDLKNEISEIDKKHQDKINDLVNNIYQKEITNEFVEKVIEDDEPSDPNDPYYNL